MSEIYDQAAFNRVLGTKFKLTADDGQSQEVDLHRVSELRERLNQRSFSIVFKGPPEVGFEQGTYHVEHPELGEMDLFLVPIALKEDGMRVEAVFNLLS